MIAKRVKAHSQETKNAHSNFQQQRNQMKISIVPGNVLHVEQSFKTLGKAPLLGFVSLIVMTKENY